MIRIFWAHFDLCSLPIWSKSVEAVLATDEADVHIALEVINIAVRVLQHVAIETDADASRFTTGSLVGQVSSGIEVHSSARSSFARCTVDAEAANTSSNDADLFTVGISAAKVGLLVALHSEDRAHLR